LVDICAFGYVTREWEILPGGISREIKAGPPYYVCSALLSLGDSVRLITRVAEEDSDILKDLRVLGASIINLPTQHTMKSRIIYLDKGLSKRELEVLSLANPFEVSDLNHCKGSGARYVYVGPLTTEDFTPEFIEEASKLGKVVIDVQGFTRKVIGNRITYVDWSWKNDAAPYIDTLKLDEGEGTLITGQTIPEKIIEHLFAGGFKEVILTTDMGVYLGIAGRDIYFQKFYTEKVIGRTGRGDTAVAAYIHSKLRGWGPQFTVRFVSAVTSIKLMSEGPFMKGEEEVLNFLKRFN